ncbi:phosphopantetheine-binding protein [Morganella psychrotolerans]|uniref:phosphopantetheine-binding protein n=1 Tax=Morganella psychrotolerans TaxID=368603 RepID=UPI0039AFD769
MAYISSVQNALKQLIIDTLNLEDIAPEEIETDAPLFGDGLGLDSIDALELGLAIKNRYGVVLSSDSDEVRKHFYSVATLAAYIDSQK